MRKICAWCRTVLDDGNGLPSQLISHGICAACVRLMDSNIETLGSFLDGLGLPVVALNGRAEVLTASRQAAELVDVDPVAMRGLRGGEALRCSNAQLPGGCGHQIPCQTCAIRKSILHTHATGESCERVRAHMHQVTGQEASPVEFRISTEQVGQVVLLRIDEVRVTSPTELAAAPEQLSPT